MRLPSRLAPVAAGLLPWAPVAGIFHVPRRRIGLCREATRPGREPALREGHGPGTWATLPLWEVAFPYAMFLAQGDKSQGVGDRVPKGHRRMRKRDEPELSLSPRRQERQEDRTAVLFTFAVLASWRENRFWMRPKAAPSSL